jgi:hypothetical protein
MSPSQTSSRTPTPTRTSSPSETASTTPTPACSPSESRSSSPTQTSSQTPSPTRSHSPTASISLTSTAWLLFSESLSRSERLLATACPKSGELLVPTSWAPFSRAVESIYFSVSDNRQTESRFWQSQILPQTIINNHSCGLISHKFLTSQGSSQSQ